jgi:opacity protein-like surface antigen
MCLSYDEKSTQTLRSQLIAAGGKMKVWKCFSFEKQYDKKQNFVGYKLTGPYQGTYFKIEADGTIRSNRKLLTRTRDEVRCESVVKGIHVYKTRKQLTCNLGYREYRVYTEVEVDINDFVGAGVGGHAVFTKIRLLDQKQILKDICAVSKTDVNQTKAKQENAHKRLAVIHAQIETLAKEAATLTTDLANITWGTEQIFLSLM